MWYYVAKVAISAVLVVIIAEVAKRSTFVGAAIASLPLLSVLALTWLYVDTGDKVQVAQLSRGIFWLVLPSLVFFLVLPVLLLKTQLHFAASLGIAMAATATSYALMVFGLSHFGVKL